MRRILQSRVPGRGGRHRRHDSPGWCDHRLRRWRAGRLRRFPARTIAKRHLVGGRAPPVREIGSGERHLDRRVGNVLGVRPRTDVAYRARAARRRPGPRHDAAGRAGGMPRG